MHLLPWPETLKEWQDAAVEEKLKIPLALRPFVLKSLEEKRQAGEIGSSLEAKVIFQSASSRDLKALKDAVNILSSFYIVSQVAVEEIKEVKESVSQDFAQTRIVIEKADGEKCSRCWNYSVHVGKDQKHPQLCERCCGIVKEIPNA